ncbi:hypothetical protein GGI43DRAFT_389756 [Trichoderma evansii]
MMLIPAFSSTARLTHAGLAPLDDYTSPRPTVVLETTAILASSKECFSSLTARPVKATAAIVQWIYASCNFILS